MQCIVALRVVVLPALLSVPGAAQEYFPAPGFAAGHNAITLALSDLDGDGRPDAVTASADGLVSVLLRTCGGFGPPATVSTGAGSKPETVALGDLDGDGDPDVAVSRDTGHLAVLCNDGAGGLQLVWDAHASFMPSDLALGDLDADGAPDAVVTGAEDDQCFVSLGTGACRFGLAQAFDAAGKQRAVTLGDLDGDGHLDVVTANTKVVVVLSGDGAGGLAAPAAFDAGGLPGDIEVGDLDGDGDPDVVLGHAYGIGPTLATLENLGGASLGPPVPYAVPDASGYALALADFDEDGWPDVGAATGVSESLAILLNDGSGSLAAATKYTTGGGPPLRAADLDGDGHLDLAAPGSLLVRVVYGDGAGGFADAERQVLDDYMSTFAVGDLDGDGLPDLVDQISNALALSLLLGDGAGGFVPAQDIVVPVHTWTVVLGELDGSPGLDLAGRSAPSLTLPEHFCALRNDGAGGFFGATTVTLPGDPWDLVLADVDGNGLQDGVLALKDLGQVGVVRALGDGAFSGVVVQAAGNQPLSLDTGDLLEDGAADVVVANTSVGSTPADLRLMLADGAGALLPSVSLGVASATGNVVADMDGDGHQDIVAYESQTGASLLLRGDGVGAFAPPEPLGSGSSAVAADINRDGALDLIDPFAGIRYGDGGGKIAASVTHALGGTGYIHVADVDGDGDLDLLAPAGNKAISILLQLDEGGSWTDLGDALAGAAGEARLSGAGLLLPATPVVLRLQDAAALAPALLFASGVDAPMPFKGGILHAPVPLQPLLTSASGEIELQGTWSAHVPPCTTLVLQVVISDASAPEGVALSNAIEARSP